jgi:hypothetical protein
MQTVMPVAIGSANEHAAKVLKLATSLRAAFAVRLDDELARVQACGMCDEMIGHAAVLMGERPAAMVPPVEAGTAAARN